MSTCIGRVEALTEKPTSNGGMAYNFKMDNGEWFGHGFSKPIFDKGSNIQFVWTANGKWKNVDTSSVEVVESSTPVTHTAPAAAKAAAVDWDGKDRRITFLACRKDSIQIASMALEHGALKLGKSKQLEILTGFIDEVANDLYTGIYGETYPVTPVTVASIEESVNDSEE
jgi:hypothetical protein